MTKKPETPAPAADPLGPEASAPEAPATEPAKPSEVRPPAARTPKAKRGKAAAEATAKMEACATLAELAAIWTGLKPEEQERDRGAYYTAKRRIAAAWRR